MKGYRTPSWFRTKGRLKETQMKARSGKAKTRKTIMGVRHSRKEVINAYFCNTRQIDSGIDKGYG